MMNLLNGNTTPLVKVVPSPSRMEVFEVRGRYFAYDVNSMAVITLDSPADLHDLRVVRHGPFINARYQPYLPAAHFFPSPVSLVLHSTQVCNLACEYCFVAQYPDAYVGTMSIETARKAIDLLDFTQHPQVGFFGGEPSLNWDLVEQATEYYFSKCESAGIPKGSPAMTTNGTTLTRERIEWLAAHNFGMIISLDGTREAHDANRIYRGGQGTYDRIMESLHLIREIAPELSRRITLRGTFPWENRKDTLVESTIHLNELVDQGFANWCSIEPAILTEKSCAVPSRDAVQSFTSDRALSLYDEYLEVADWMVERFKAGKPARFHQISKFVERLFWGNHAWTECGGGVGYMSVDHNGDIYACHRLAHTRIGNLDTGGVDESLREKWRENRTVARPQCRECKLQYVCGGGCFTGDTLVSLMDGTEVPFSALVECDSFWVYAYDQMEGRIVPAKATCKLTRRDAPLVEVGLDNGERIRCTPDHEWMLRGGSYCRADELRVGDSLMPLYRRLSVEGELGPGCVGYEMYQDPGNGDWLWAHRLAAEFTEIGVRYINGELVFGCRERGQDTRHHLNGNKRDNRPENIGWMRWPEHQRYHADKISELNRTPEARRRSGDKLRDFNASGGLARKNKSERQRRAVSRAMQSKLSDPNSKIRKWVDSDENKRRLADQGRKESVCPRCDRIFSNRGCLGNHLRLQEEGMPCRLPPEMRRKYTREGYKKVLGERTKERNKTPLARAQSRLNMMRVWIWRRWKLANGPDFSHRKFLDEVFLPYEEELVQEYAKDPETYWEALEAIHELSPNNHKVTAVRFLETREDVYCLEIPEHHNFALSAGVFVHNCREEALGYYISHQDLYPDDAIKMNYPVMCSFKECWMAAALWILSETPRDLLARAIKNPFADRLKAIRQEHKRRSSLLSGPTNRIFRSCATCDAC